MALFFGVNVGLAEGATSTQTKAKAARKPSRFLRWLFAKRQARMG